MGRGPWTPEFIDSTLVGLVDRVMRRLRAARRVGRTVVLRLRFDDFSRATRSHTLVEATNETRTVLVAARALLAAATPTIEREGITLVGITVANLDDDDQLALPLDRPAAALDAVLDEVRERFGVNSVTRAVLLGRSQSQGVPLLPD
jgi:DNA polymerase-4